MMLKDRDIARDIAVFTKTNEDWTLYRKLRNQCNKKVKQDRIDYQKTLYDNYDKETNTKNTFKLSKEILGWKNGKTPTTFHRDGQSVTGQQEIAEMQNQFYKEKISKLNNQLPQSNLDPLKTLKESIQDWQQYSNIPEFEFLEISDNEMLKLISELGSSTSYGHDTIDSLSIKIAALELQQPLRHIVNLSLKQGRFAHTWKIARVIPLYKGKDNNENLPEAYRLISVYFEDLKVDCKSWQTMPLENVGSNPPPLWVLKSRSIRPKKKSPIGHPPPSWTVKSQPSKV